MNKEEFIEEVNKLGLTLKEEQLYQLAQYYHLLIEENEKINLTAITEEKQVYLKHFYDSLTLMKAVSLKEVESLCDIGTGAGFPGLVLKIAFPSLTVTLVDALNKRILFLNKVIEELGLENICAVHARMEEYARVNKDVFDIVTARAVAPLKELVEYGAPALKVGGRLIFMKGNLKEEELENMERVMNTLKLENMEKEVFLLPIENSTRTLISFVKKEPTPKKYPRKYKEIKNYKW